jgi:hypothetical protein
MAQTFDPTKGGELKIEQIFRETQQHGYLIRQGSRLAIDNRLNHPRQCQDFHPSGSGRFQCPGTGIHRGTGGEHIINK